MARSQLDRLEMLRAIINGKTPPVQSPDPAQRPLLYVPDLPSQAFHDAAAFPWTAQWRESFASIAAELGDCLERREGFVPIFPGYADAGSWAGLWFLLYGERYAGNCTMFPKTMELIEAIPRLAGWAAYSAMPPGSHVRPHCGTTNAKLRMHLAVHADPGSEMRVRDKFYSWSEGNIMVFDDSYEHEVWVRGTRPRIVLICDFYHPDLSDEEVQLLDSFEVNPSPYLKNESLRGRYQRVAKAFSSDLRDINWLYE